MDINLPKIALLGYGQMGREIEYQARQRGYIVTEIFDYNKQMRDGVEYEFDVAIDFSMTNTVLKNVELVAKQKKNIVLGTTGWQDSKDKIQEIVDKYEIGLIWGSNFSVGMQMFFKMVESVSKIVNKIDEYDVMVHELHHKKKLDSPSGTALSIANIILKEIDFKKNILTDKSNGEIPSDTLHVSSTRGGFINGIHSVYIDSSADTIELKHEAKNRSGFALGSLRAANWIKDKKGMFEFREVIEDIWGI